MEKLLNKFWKWCVFMGVCLIVIHILFTISAPFEWLEATWTSGELITFIGTMTLGYISYSQTKKSYEISKSLIELQEDEYTPTLAVSDFIGVSKLKMKNIKDDISKVVVGEYQMNDGSIVCGLMICVNIDESNMENERNTYSYEIVLKNVGKQLINDITIYSMEYDNGITSENINIEKDLNISLEADNDVHLIINLVGNKDFISDERYYLKYIHVPKLKLNFEITTFNKRYYETICITKHYIKNNNQEVMVAKSYTISEGE